MLKSFYILVFLFVFLACTTKKGEKVQESTSFEISTQKWPEITKFKGEAAKIINNWPEFKALQNSFNAIYDVSNTEDLSLALENLIEKQKELQTSIYPEEFDIPQIKSRQKVFHTYLLKTKGDLIYSIDASNSVVQMIDALNAIIEQCNTITSNTMNLEELLEDE